MSDQDDHGRRMKNFMLEPGSHERLKALLDKKEKEAKPRRKKKVMAQSGPYDPIAAAMEDHPGLTREQAEKDAAAFGF